MIIKVTPWTTGELRILRENGALGAVALAALLGRSVGSVRQAAWRHRISLRPAGCRCGRVLGQPRGVSLRAEIREALIVPERAELVARRLKIDRDADLCPDCGRRPIRVASSGRCLVCHLTELTARLRETAAEEDAQRGYDVAKQRAHRNAGAAP